MRKDVTRNLQVVMFSTVTFVPTYNNICTIYDKKKEEETYLYNIGYPDAITFLNGIIPSRDIFHTCNELRGGPELPASTRRKRNPPDTTSFRFCVPTRERFSRFLLCRRATRGRDPHTTTPSSDTRF